MVAALNFGYRLGSRLMGRSTAAQIEQRLQRPYAPATAWYTLLEAYYRNDPYDVLTASAYKGAHGLPRSLRPIYNPTKRAVDWYPGHVYPQGYGVIPFADGTAPELEDAITAAFVQWGNWDRLQSIYVRTGARVGNVLIELESDTASGRVYPIIVHPSLVTAIDLNHRGDVLMVEITIPMYDDAAKRPYTYGKRITRDTITTLYDGEPKGYDGNEATLPNPFPFAPAVWVPHTATGDTLGAPVIDGVIAKIDEANRIATSINDFIGKFNRQGVVFASSAPPVSLKRAIDAQNANARVATDLADPYAESQELPYFAGPADLTAHRLIENMGIGEAYQYLVNLLAELGDDLPETTLDKNLRAMTNVTGPGAARMTSDVVNRLGEAQRNYDWGLVRAAQMAVTMGAMLAHQRTDGWARQTPAQRAFLPFDETSFDDGQIDFALADRPLYTETDSEAVAVARQVETLTTTTGMERAGLTPAQIYGTGDDGEALAPTRQDGLLAEREAAMQQAQTASVLRFNSGLGG